MSGGLMFLLLGYYVSWFVLSSDLWLLLICLYIYNSVVYSIWCYCFRYVVCLMMFCILGYLAFCYCYCYATLFATTLMLVWLVLVYSWVWLWVVIDSFWYFVAETFVLLLGCRLLFVLWLLVLWVGVEWICLFMFILWFW